MWLRQQTFISDSSGVWEAQDQGVSWLSVWWELSLWFADNHLVFSRSRERDLMSLPLLIRAPPSKKSSNLKLGPTSKLYYTGLGLQQWILGGTWTFSPELFPERRKVLWVVTQSGHSQKSSSTSAQVATDSLKVRELSFLSCQNFKFIFVDCAIKKLLLTLFFLGGKVIRAICKCAERLERKKEIKNHL